MKILAVFLSAVMEERRRLTVGELLRAGQSAKEIITITGYPNSTVYRAVAALRAGGDASRCPHAPRADRKRKPRFLNGLRMSVKANPRTSMKILARDRHVSKSTISRAIREDLGMRSYVRKRLNLLTERAKEIRRERTPKVLNLLKHRGGNVRVFLDEKKFVVDEVANRRRIYFSHYRH